ncbi:MAG: hypothetical protein IPO42_11220 [Chitinophagaceae bacterium]|nr:hypothetical protein [Chitinophagaceae bacterium]
MKKQNPDVDAHWEIIQSADRTGFNRFHLCKIQCSYCRPFDKHISVKFAGVDELKSISITGDVLSAEDYDKWAATNDAKKKSDTPSKSVNSTKSKQP